MEDRRRDGGTNFILRTKEQGTHLTLNEHDDDENNDNNNNNNNNNTNNDKIEKKKVQNFFVIRRDVND